MVDFRPVGDEAVLLDEVACELGETITLAVTVKGWSEEKSEKATGVRGSAAYPVLHADVHHAAEVQAR